MSTHHEQAERIAEGAFTGWTSERTTDEIRAALDAAARTALLEAAEDIERYAVLDVNRAEGHKAIADLLRARAASLGEQK